MVWYWEKSLFSVRLMAAQKRTFSLYLLCLIQERGQEKWLMDQNIDFRWTGGFIIVIMHGASLRTQSQSAVKTPPLRPQGLPSNRCYEIMRDLSQWINNWTVFFSPLCAVIVWMQNTAVLTCWKDAVPSTVNLTTGRLQSRNTWEEHTASQCSLYLQHLVLHAVSRCATSKCY